MCAVARYYDISSKADRGEIFIVHDQKSSYRTPLAHDMSFPRTELLLFNYAKVNTVFHSMAPLK